MSIERVGMRTVLLPLMLATLSIALLAQKSERHKHTATKTNVRDRELIELQRSVQQREQQIQELAKRERATLRAVEQLQELLARQRRYLHLLSDEINALAERQRELESKRRMYGDAYEQEVERLRRLILILAATEPDEDATLDTAVVGSAFRQVGKRLYTVRRHRDSTDRVLDRLQQYRAARQLLLAHQRREERRLERLLALRSQLLEKLRRDRQAVEQELRTLRKSMEAIERRIERMNKPIVSSRKEPATSEKKLTGLLPPVRGTILRGYGEYRHPLTGARTFNAGIDIAVPVGTLVKASAEGRVVLVQWLPAMNNVVIIEHTDGLRTVYGNLDRALVRVGEHVTAGQTVGTSGETLSGAYVHFELWRGAERLDPTFVVR